MQLLVITTCELPSEQEIPLLKSLRELSVADHRNSRVRNARRAGQPATPSGDRHITQTDPPTTKLHS